MHHALGLPELQLSILSHLPDNKSKRSIALTCHAWEEVGLKCLWETMESMGTLVGLLGKLRGTHQMDFVTPISANGRVAFNRYTRYIRYLRLNFLDVDCMLSPRVFAAILDELQLGQLHGLPNLIDLDVVFTDSIDLHHSLLFMTTPKISVLRLTRMLYGRFPLDTTAAGFSSYFSCLSKTAPNIRTLVCHGDTLAREWALITGGVRIELVAFWMHLESVEFGMYTATSTVIQGLSLLSKLSHVRFSLPKAAKWGLLGMKGYKEAVVPFCLNLPPGAFPALIEFWFCATFGDAERFVAGAFAPQLRVLGIHLPSVEYAPDLHALLKTLSCKRPHLTELHISSSFFPLTSRNRILKGPVTLAILAPLQNLHDLVHLSIPFHQPFIVSNTEFLTLATQWPAMQTLELCSDPYNYEQPTLTRDVLPMIAECCPALRRLALYIQTHPTPTRANLTQFTALGNISFGTSSLHECDIDSFIEYLGSLLAPSLACSISVNHLAWPLEGIRRGQLCSEWERLTWMIYGVRRGTHCNEWEELNHRLRDL